MSWREGLLLCYISVIIVAISYTRELDSVDEFQITKHRLVIGYRGVFMWWGFI